MSDSPTATIKRNIQALLRELAIKSDGGCVLQADNRAGAGRLDAAGVQDDRAPHRFHVGDWKAIEIALTAELQAS